MHHKFMEWENSKLGERPVKSWCARVEKGALEQAVNLANHPRVFRHVALMPDCHVGYGMPIGGVIACKDAVIPNAVGVDIGCGMCAVQTDFPAVEVTRRQIVHCLEKVKRRVPLGEGHCHKQPQQWDRFEELPAWLDKRTRELAYKNLGTLGGGNHFIELQAGDDGKLWLMLHSGSRNLGYRIAEHHHKKAVNWCERHNVLLPSKDLAFFDTFSAEGKEYIREMNFALDYARENRARMMQIFKETVSSVLGKGSFLKEINIHHNYVAKEEHFGQTVWVHRKGATSAKAGEEGIIPGSMGTASFIVRGLGNPESFESCSHGAGRILGRMAASRTLSKEECDRAMEGIVFFGWHTLRGPELDLIEPIVKLKPLGVLKG